MKGTADVASAIGYIRRSRVSSDRPGAVSHEAQTTAVRELAKRHGFDDLQIPEDWGKSGGAGKEGKRSGYKELRDAIRDGAVTDVFAYDQSRLTRSTLEWASLVADCRKHHVKVHLVNGGTKDFDSVDGRMTADILASVAQAERERGQERGAITWAHRIKRGDVPGPPRYGWRADGRKGHEGELVSAAGEDVAAVVDLYRACGSFTATARELNARGVPNKRAGRLDPRTEQPSIWRAQAVRRIIRREAPELITEPDQEPRGNDKNGRTIGAGRGIPAHPPYRLARLLRCPCGGILTPFRHTSRDAAVAVSYRCQRSYTDKTHSKPSSVPEHVLASFIVEELGHFRQIDAETARAAGEERAAIIQERERLALGHARGGLPTATYLKEDEALLERLAALPRETTIEVLGPLDDLWTDWEPEDANTTLRHLWSAILLGPDMRPMPGLEGFVWRNPALRAP